MRITSIFPPLLAVLILLTFQTGNIHAAPPAKERTRVSLANFPFDTARGEPSVPASLKGRPAAPGRPGYVIIKFRDKINEAARARLKSAGVRFQGYVPDDAFTARVPAGKLSAVTSDPDVAAVYEFKPAYRLERKLLDRVSTGRGGTVRLVVQAFDGEPLSPIMQEVVSLGGSVAVYSDTEGINGKALKVSIDASKLAQLAAIDGVAWAEEDVPASFTNDVADDVVGTGYPWGVSTPLTGARQVVGIADSGLDTGDTSTVHLDFRGDTSLGLPKIKQTFGYARHGDWSDLHGHGTHTAGSLAGFGVQSGLLEPGTLMRGMAYDAQLVFQSVGLDSAGNIFMPNINTVVFPDAYAAGARVHSNSWGYNGSYGAYTLTAAIADTYTWNHKDFTALFSAGNEGVDESPQDGIVDATSVVSPGTAKNVITVGASENNRPSIPTTWGTAIPGGFQPPILNDRLADDPNGMAAFSSRGPCMDGRIKPDVVAPGTYVVSARSSASANPVVLPSKYEYPSSLDPYYAYMSGTSMACPLTAGVAALVHQFLQEQGRANPSSALIKAMLVAGAADMTPGQYSGGQEDVTARPDMSQGWGRVDATESMFPAAPKRLFFDDYTAGLATSETMTYTIALTDATVPVRVNVAWTDYPGVQYSNPTLVNDLDLSVTAPDGTAYHGNEYNGSGSVADPADYDRLNNVEGVSIPAASLTTGTLTVVVAGYNVPMGPQPFGIVVTGGFTGPSVSGITPDTGVNNVSTPVTISGSGFVTGAKAYVGGAECSVSGSTNTSIDAVVPPGIGAGARFVTVVNPDGQTGALAGAFTVVQDATIPSDPQGLTASASDASVNLRWTPGAASDLAGHRVYFNTYSTTVGTGGTHSLTGLTNGMAYDIYVRALDTAGNLSGPTNTVTATPFAAVTELPHYSWDGSPQWDCTGCHITAASGLLPVGFDYRSSGGLCLSCHNAVSVAHDRAVDGSRSHPVYVNVTSGGARIPVFGSVTSGEFSDTMYTHLADGDKLACVTCHNPMRKPYDTGRSWEFTSSSDGMTYDAQYGGWWDQGHAVVRVYRDGTLWTPAYSKDRELLKHADDGYSVDSDAGSVGFDNATTGYVYLTLDDAYLRVSGSDNTICSDCHTAQTTHRELNCIACHTSHNTTNIALVRGKVRSAYGTLSPVVFGSMSGVNSFADGDGVYDGICEVCHTQTLYYRSDGSVMNNHTGAGLDYSGQDCSSCHTHGSGFAR